MLTLIAFLLCAADNIDSIAFLSGTSSATLCVFVFDEETQTVKRVGRGEADREPQWSPDGLQLTFESRRDNGTGIYVVRHDGSDGRFLETRHTRNAHPVWSPNGSLLAYSAGPQRIIAVYNLDEDREEVWGNGKTSLTRPQWLRDTGLAAELAFGDRAQGLIAFQRLGLGQPDNSAILAVGISEEPEGHALDIFVLTSFEAYRFPEWVLPSPEAYAEWAVKPSPNGRDIAFESNDGGDREIFVYSRRGTHDATNHRAADWDPVWSPDGKWIAFESFRSGRRAIYRVHKDTNRVLAVTASEIADTWAPSWSPDGRRIAYVSNETGSPAIFVRDLQDDRTMQLPSSPSPQYAPAWRPHIR